MNWYGPAGNVLEPGPWLQPYVGIFVEGIEEGLNHLEYVMACGKYCDNCGEWRITHLVDYNEETPTHRGTEYRLMPYNLCDECDPADRPFRTL